MHDFKQFVKDRDSAMRSLDETKILEYCRKYGVPIPANETLFWCGIHKARIQLNSITEDEKQISRQWLNEHGFQTTIFGM